MKKDIFVPPYRYCLAGQQIYDGNNNLVLDIRGWGYLTGTGGLNLIDQEAVEIQDNFGQHVVDCLNRESTEQ